MKSPNLEKDKEILCPHRDGELYHFENNIGNHLQEFCSGSKCEVERLITEKQSLIAVLETIKNHEEEKKRLGIFGCAAPVLNYVKVIGNALSMFGMTK